MISVIMLNVMAPTAATTTTNVSGKAKCPKRKLKILNLDLEFGSNDEIGSK